MSLADVRDRIHKYIEDSSSSRWIQETFRTEGDDTRLYVIKYVPAKHLDDILATRTLFASPTPGYTWGDAVYVAPLVYPRTTMMYGAVGVIGWVDPANVTFYNAADATGISYYQEWITYFPDLYRQLTTTVHANHANRTLRNEFRTHFGIDCVYFRPDEPCPSYVDDVNDLWLALTEWNGARKVASGNSSVVKDLKWVAIGTEAFEPQGLGYRALLHPALSHARTFRPGGYNTLSDELFQAYSDATAPVVITKF